MRLRTVGELCNNFQQRYNSHWCSRTSFRWDNEYTRVTWSYAFSLLSFRLLITLYSLAMNLMWKYRNFFYIWEVSSVVLPEKRWTTFANRICSDMAWLCTAFDECSLVYTWTRTQAIQQREIVDLMMMFLIKEDLNLWFLSNIFHYLNRIISKNVYLELFFVLTNKRKTLEGGN